MLASPCARPAPTTHRRSRELVLIAGSGLAMLAIFAAVKSSLIDDAYITLDYARNLAQHLHWGLTAQETANTATSPLNVVMIAVLAAVSRIGGGGPHPIFALGVVSVFAAMTLAWGWIRVARAAGVGFGAAVVGVATVLVNPFLLSALGLEVLLIPAALVWLVAMAQEGRPIAYGVVGGLAVLARIDLIVFVVMIALSAPAIRRSWLPALGTLVGVVAPWFIASWFALDSLVPDTLVLKLAQPGLFAPWTYFTGPRMYYGVWPAATALTFLPAALGACALAAWAGMRLRRRSRSPVAAARLGPAAALAAAGVVYYALYSLLRLPPYHWYYVPPTTALSTFLVVAAGVWSRRENRRGAWRVAPRALVGVAGALALAALAADTEPGVPWRSPVVSTNWTTAATYARIGAAVAPVVGTTGVSSPGEIGTLAYYCHCAMIDAFSDRGDAVRIVNQQIATANPVTRFLLKINYARLDRREQPHPAAFSLSYVPGPGTGPYIWQVSSRWRGIGHFILSAIPHPAAPTGGAR